MKENKIAVIIAEGGSEKTFLTGLLQSTYSFTPITDKGPICFKKEGGDQIWLFPVPHLGKIHAGGNNILLTEDPYIKAETVLLSHSHIYSKHPSIHYYVLTDTDGVPKEKIIEREKLIKEASAKANIEYTTFEVHFPHQEIETWFMAGVKDEFPHFSKTGGEELELVVNDLENLIDPKEFMDKILNPSISGNRMDIGAQVGRYFDINKAKNKSPSFKRFIASLEEKDLL